MSAADITKLRTEVIARIKSDRYPYPEKLSLDAVVADTARDVFEIETMEDITDNHKLIVHLATQGLRSSKCSTCNGRLIGREIAFGTCGHCGGRSITPTR